MALKEELEQSGNWLFRWRSYLPLLLAGLFLIALRDIKYLGNSRFAAFWEIFCLAVSLLGLGIRFVTIGYVPFGTSGRNTKGQVASVLNTTGIYSIVRHPLYLGNALIWLGISLVLRLWWFSLLVMLIFWVYYERIMFAEEKFLQDKFGEAFSQWAARTPAVLPNFKNWTRPDLPFSVKTALRREYSTFFAISVIFTFLDFITGLVISGRLALNTRWVIIFAASLLIYVTVRFIHKSTTLLNVAGR